MAGPTVLLTKWNFTRPDPSGSCSQYFRTDMRKIANWTDDKPNYNLPWASHMYLAYPSQDQPNWPEFIAHLKQLNIEAQENRRYKIIYIMRRAHTFKYAIETTGIPSPDVIVTSPLARAFETTQRGVRPLAPSVAPIVLEGLREKLNGEARNERHEKSWIQQHFTGFQVENVDADDSLGSKYARSVEPYELLWLRVKDAFGFIFENFPDALVVALVSHCHAIQKIQREITGYDLSEEERKDGEFRLGDAGVYAIVVKGERLSSHEENLSPAT
ncbi:MAG: hypothetical protein Q9181_005932 [Wetmoreana brouardii]